jgi:hypothetical protein
MVAVLLQARKEYSDFNKKGGGAYEKLSGNLKNRSQASVAVYLNSSVFWVITKRVLIKHRRFRTTYKWN